MIRKRKEKRPTPMPIPVETDAERLRLAVVRMAINQGTNLTVQALNAYASILEEEDNTLLILIREAQKEKDELFGNAINSTR